MKATNLIVFSILTVLLLSAVACSTAPYGTEGTVPVGNLIAGQTFSYHTRVDWTADPSDHSGLWRGWHPFTVEHVKEQNEVEYWAVLVGISDYLLIGDLAYAAKDAQDVREALLTSEVWSSEHIILLTDSNATAAAIQTAIAQVGSVADSNDLFLFHFSGHGGTQADVAPLDEGDGRDEYLCPYDFPTYGILDDDLGQWLGDLPMTRVAVAIDSCHSGGMIRAQSDGILSRCLECTGSSAKGDGFSRDLDDVLEGVVLTACAEDETAVEVHSLQNGLFTFYFIEGLLSMAADANGNGEVSMEEAFDYLYPRVVGFPLWVQHPQIFDNYEGELGFFGRPPPSRYDIPLGSGWNLISLPLIPDSANIEDILADIMNDVDSVWAYDNATGSWASYAPGEPSDLTEMTCDKGYWVEVNDPCTLTVDDI